MWDIFQRAICLLLTYRAINKRVDDMEVALKNNSLYTISIRLYFLQVLYRTAMGPAYVEISLSKYICIKTRTVNLPAMEQISAQMKLWT